MDIEIVANAYRYFRYLRGIPVDHLGRPGLGFDPRDFFSIVVVTICKTNIVCDGKVQKDSVEAMISDLFEKDGFGVFIRSPEGLEPASSKFQFEDEDACDFGDKYLDFLIKNTQSGRVETR